VLLLYVPVKVAVPVAVLEGISWDPDALPLNANILSLSSISSSSLSHATNKEQVIRLVESNAKKVLR